MYANKNPKTLTDEALREEISFAEKYLRQYPATKGPMHRWLTTCRDTLARREVGRAVCEGRYAA